MDEVAENLLDSEVRLGDAVIAQQLFAEHLPIYELPRVDRMPRQRAKEAHECRIFNPDTALDLLELSVRQEVREWFELARLDAECLEKEGPRRERRHKSPILVLGQQRFRVCARGLVWDCRSSLGCRPPDHDESISTHFDLPNLRRRFAN